MKWFRFFLGIVSGFLLTLFLINFLIMPMLTKSQKVIVMPDLIGMGEAAAESLLKNFGLEIGEKRWAFSLEYSEGKVIAQNPRPRIKVKKGKVVEITLSKGRGKAIVPDFSGKKVSEFLEALALVGLEAKLETVYGENEGEVKNCIPGPGSVLEKGSVVRVLVVKREGFVLMPRLVGLKLEEARRVLDSLGLVLEEVREKEGEEEAGTVIFQYPEEEMRVRIGGKVVLVLTKGKR
ncbi:MAG: PASTA domain-containing protein [candidate division WOR-3 bacterium]